MAREQKEDQPVMLAYALIGNDVCNGHFGTSHMTTPQDFYLNVLDSLVFLNSSLPFGSHVTFMGISSLLLFLLFLSFFSRFFFFSLFVRYFFLLFVSYLFYYFIPYGFIKDWWMGGYCTMSWATESIQ